MFQIALTGGIASGKTTVSNEFKNLGVPIIDADIIAREVVAPGSTALGELIELFGRDILNDDGSLNRPALRKIIFSDTESKKKVEAILHPAIRQRSALSCKLHTKNGAHYIIHSIPLLIETGQSNIYDRVLVVDVPLDIQIARVMERDSISRESAFAIINSQASREERLNVADDVVLNTNTLEHLRTRVKELHTMYNMLANNSRTAGTTE